MKTIIATAHVYGDNIDTDRIIPGKYTKTLDLSHLAAHVLEDLDASFKDRVQAGDILVAGENFGCGSSREQAPLALKVAGISVIVADYFARIFFRNAINIGLPVVEIGPHNIQNGACLAVDLFGGTVTDESAGQVYKATKMPAVMVEILQAGGLVEYLKEYGTYLNSEPLANKFAATITKPTFVDWISDRVGGLRWRRCGFNRRNY